MHIIFKKRIYQDLVCAYIFINNIFMKKLNQINKIYLYTRNIHYINIIIISLLTGLILMSIGCSSRKELLSEPTESKPNSIGSYKIFKDNQDEDIPLYQARYNFIVTKKNNGAILCEGETTLITYSNMKVKAQGGANCKLSKDIDLSTIISDNIKLIPFETVKQQQLDHRIVWITQYGNAIYEPYKPYIIQPIIQNMDKFKNIDISHALNVKIIPQTAKESVNEGSGMVQIKMLEVGITYKPQDYHETFNNVVRWGIYANGFETLKTKADASLYKVYEYYWSTRPIIILKIHIESPLKDFKPGLIGAIGDMIIGDICVDLNIKEYNLLN